MVVLSTPRLALDAGRERVGAADAEVRGGRLPPGGSSRSLRSSAPKHQATGSRDRGALPVRRALLIVNPAARQASRREAAACAAFTERGVTCDVAHTERAGHAAEIATARGGDYDAVFTLGGDGTAMEVVGALAGGEVPVGVLPGGTGNLIARTLGIPLRPAAAVRILLDGVQARIDLGVVRAANGVACRFAFAAGIGIDARMIEETPARLKRRLGVLAYALTAARAVLERERFPTRVVVDDVEVVERDAAAVMVVNFGAVLGDLFRLGPGIRHDDGRLDLCVFSPATHADAVRVFWRLLRKDFRDDPAMLFRRGGHFVIETTPSRAVQADGELLGATPVEIVVEPLAACLLVPSTS